MNCIARPNFTGMYKSFLSSCMETDSSPREKKLRWIWKRGKWIPYLCDRTFVLVAENPNLRDRPFVLDLLVEAQPPPPPSPPLPRGPCYLAGRVEGLGIASPGRPIYRPQQTPAGRHPPRRRTPTLALATASPGRAPHVAAHQSP
jgi:hypothetical protein